MRIWIRLLATGACFQALNVELAYGESCDSIVTHGLRNIEISQSREASVATRYFNHCQKDFERMDEATMVQAEVEIFGQGAGSGAYNNSTRKERLTQWCTTNRETAAASRGVSNEAQTFYQGAVTAWVSCKNLLSKDVRITPVISPDAKTVDIGIVYFGATTSGVELFKINSEGFGCVTTTPNGKPLPQEIRNRTIQVQCRRDPTADQSRDGEDYKVLPRGTISVQTASEPFQLYFPEEWVPSIPMKQVDVLRREITRSEIPVGTLILSTLTVEQFGSPANTQYPSDKWIRADGRILPKDSRYQRITGSASAPDLRVREAGLIVNGISQGELNSHENLQSLAKLGMPLESWSWMISGRDLQGQTWNNDYEQAADRFVVSAYAKGVVTATGSTYNFKHGKWGGPADGSVNVLGISTSTSPSLYHYLKIN